MAARNGAPPARTGILGPPYAPGRPPPPRAGGRGVSRGGGAGRDWSEAEVMARWTRDTFGIRADRIRTETKAENTWQN
ncbi:ElyC/SanA/YdcF family protein, partial [Nocardia wallacei]|uniref:ElyC/SanA/YdcF family protein n=1 Tax=Nocardia wallacei TaxID=480035 RepID=UPI002458CD17